MGALVNSIGVAVVDKPAFEQRLAHGAPCMMDHPITERGGRDDPVLGIEDFDLPVSSGAVAAGAKLPLQSQNLHFQVGQKRGHARLDSLTLRGPKRRGVQRLESGNGFKQIPRFPWQDAPCARRLSGAPSHQGIVTLCADWRHWSDENQNIHILPPSVSW